MGNYDFFTAAQNDANKAKTAYDFLMAAKSGADYTWNDEAKKKYIQNNMYELKLNDGRSFGKITGAGYKAIENNTLDSYKPFNAEEKKTIEEYTSEQKRLQSDAVIKQSDAYIKELEKQKTEAEKKREEISKQRSDYQRKVAVDKRSFRKIDAEESKEKLAQYDAEIKPLTEQINSFEMQINVVKEETNQMLTALKYDIDLNNFGVKEFDEWAKKHNFEFVTGSDGDGGRYIPKKEGTNFLGLGGKKLTTEEEEKDLMLLQHISNTNNAKQLAEKYPTATSVGTVVVAPIRNIVGLAAVVEDTINTARGKGINIYSDAHNIGNMTNTMRSTVADKYASKWFGGGENAVVGNVGEFTYNTLMSMGDNIANLLFAKFVAGGAGLSAEKVASVTSNITTGLMSSGAAADHIVNNKQKGLSNERALALGISQGLVESLTEKFSIDAIIGEPKTLLKGVLKGFAAEGVEEMTAEVLNKYLDYVVSGAQSDIIVAINSYIKDGYDKKTAIEMAFADSLMDVFRAGLSGGFSGAGMSGSYHGINRVKISNVGRNIVNGKYPGVTLGKAISKGLTFESNTETYKMAADLATKQTEGSITIRDTYSIGKMVSDILVVDKNAFGTAVKESFENNSKNAGTDETVRIGTPEASAAETKTGSAVNVTRRDAENTTTTPIKNAVVAENATTEKNVVDDYESEADELMATDMSEDVEETAANTAEVAADNATTETELTSVKIGDVYVADGKTYTIIGRENGITTYTVTDENGNTVTRTTSNVTADINFTKEDVFTKVQDGTVATNLTNFGQSGIINTKTNGDVLNGKEEAIYLRPDSVRRSDLDTGRAEEIARTGTKDAQNLNGTQESKTVSHKTVKDGTIEFTPIAGESYTEGMNAVTEENKAFGFDTIFADGEIKIYNKNGELVRTLEDGGYNPLNKTIYINAKTNERIEDVSSHEKVHGIKRINSESYDKLLKKVTDCVDEDKFVEEINSYVSLYESVYKQKADVFKTAEEIFANLSYEINSDEIPAYVVDAEGIKKAYSEFWETAKATTTTTETKNEAVVNGEETVSEDKDQYEIMERLGLTYEEQRAILKYKSGESYKINELLRKRKALSTEQEKLKNDLISAIDRFPTYKGTVYRNIGFETKEEFDEFVFEHNGKTSITYFAFTSASKTIDGYLVDVPYKVHYEILSHNSKDVSGIGLTKENEVLFKTDTAFAVKSFEVNGNEITILCEELANNGTELHGSVGKTGNKEKSNGYAEQSDNIRRWDENAQTVDSVREGSGEIYGISHEKPTSERGNVGNSNLSDSMELRKVDRNVSVAQRELERENLSLKHIKNVDSLFKNAERVIVGKDIISDGFVAIPLTNEALAEVKKVAGDVMQENPNFSLSIFYHKDNDVVIRGNPKTDEITVKRKREKAYVFKIGDAFYTCQQKYIDAFNNGKNIITASKRISVPWNVHNENGEFVALFLGANHAMNDERFNSLQSVSEALGADVKRFVKDTAANVVKSDKTVIETDESVIKQADFVTEAPESVKNTSDNVPEEKTSSKKTNELFKKLTNSIHLLENDAIVYAATGNEFEAGEKKLSQQVYEYFERLGGIVHRENFGDVAINDKGVDSSIAHGMGRAKAIAFASVPAVIEKGRQIDFVENWKGRNYDSYVFAAPIQIGTQRAFVGVVVTKSDTDNRYYLHEVSDNEGNIIVIKKDDASFKSKSEATNDSSLLGETSPTNIIAQDNDVVNETVIETVESVTEPTESVIKQADSVKETPENEKITVGMSDDVRAELLNKKSVNVVSVDAENTKALDNVDLDALQKTLTRHAKPIIEKVAKDFGILNKTYFNPDIELDFEYSRGSLKESMNKQHTMYGDFVKMLSVFSDVIENAVGVETHEDKYVGTTREDASLKQMYVLASALSDETGIIPVKLEVKEFNDKANKLYLSVVLTKKEDRYPHGNLGQSPLNTATPASTISIADLVGIVNPSEGDFLKYFPDSMLDSEQIESKNKALAKEAEKVEKLTEDKKRSLATAENANALSSTPETTSSTASNNIVSQDADIVNSSVRNDAENDTSKVYDVAYFEKLGSDIRKGESVTETPENEKITVGMSDDVRAELLNKKSVNVVSVDAENTKALDNVDLDALQKTYPSYARPIIKKIARDFGILNEPFFNPDIELEFSYSGDSIQESINKQHSRYGDFIKMLSVFSDVIENAVGVETHKDKYTGTRREDTNLKQMYVLASAFSDEKGVYPVKLEVKEFKKNTNKLYLSVVLAKKESRYLSGNLGQDQLNTAPPTSTISIADLVGIVNPSEGDFLKYFPDSMLDSEQIESKNKALAKEAEKVEKLTEDKKRSLATAENANGGVSLPEVFKRDANGKIRFNQADIDYTNNQYREESFNTLKQGGTGIETQKGGIIGKYGIHKKSNGYFGVNLLSSGMDIAAFATFDEALSFAAYTNKEVSFNDISYVRNADGRLTIDATPEFMQYGEQIKAIKSEKAYLQTKTSAESVARYLKNNADNGTIKEKDDTESNNKSVGEENSFDEGNDDIRYNLESEGNINEKRNDVDASFSLDDTVEQTGVITKADVEAIQSIGRKSVNDFTSEDIAKTENFARKYFEEMSIKSPFFRAWFGDWRENDKTSVHVVTERGNERGVAENKDTGWDIQISGKVFNETKSHNSIKSKNAVPYLDYINGIVENAVLLDSYTIDKPKSDNSAIMHSLYSLVDTGNGTEVVKLYVEELNNVNDDGTINRAYQLQDIINAPAASVRVQNNLSSLTNTASGKYSVADLFNIVKQNDKDFNPKPASAMVDEEGNPLMVYHGTDKKFTVFDMSKGRANMDIQGSFFSPWKLEAQGYGANVGKYYLSIKNPADGTTAFAALNRFKGQDSAGIKAREYLIKQGYDGVNFYDEEYVAFYPAQIKSATDNIGAFDRNNSDIRYSAEVEKGVLDSEKRNNVTARSVGWGISESADKSGRSFYETTGRVEEKGGQRTDTESSRRIYAENVRAVQGTEIRRQGAFRCEFIKPGYYTDDMKAIEESNKKQGIKHTYFFLDSGEVAFKSSVKFRGAVTKNGDVYIQCNHPKYSPEQINKHELVHHNYNTEDVKKVREYINKNLTEEEKRYIVDVMYARYALVCKGNADKVFEEFVCDVLSGINSYGGKFADISQEYWSKHTDRIDSYSAADYSDSIDAGGVSLSTQEYIEPLRLPKQEYAMVSKAIMAKNAGLTDKDLKPVDYVYAADEFYVYENHSVGDFTVSNKISIEGNEELINNVRGEIENGTYRSSETPYTLVKEYKSRRGSNNRNNGGTESAGTHGNNVGLSLGQSESDTIRHLAESSRVEKINYSSRGLRVPKAEYYKFSRAVGTDYYNKNKTHNGLQYQSVVGTDEHILYVYEDYGFDNYKIVGRVDYANAETANKVMELIDNGRINRISDLVGRLSEWLETRQGSYSIYNAYTKKRRSSRGVRSLSQRQSRSDTRGTDGSGRRDAENGGTGGISFSLEEDGEFDLFDLIADAMRESVLYEGHPMYSMDKWYPDLSRNQLSKLNDFIKKDVEASTHSITDTANWTLTTIGNTKVFAIYSTENMTGPTLLYESKGRQGEFEKDYLLNLLEEWNYGKSNDSKSSRIDEILSDERLQKRYGVQNNNGTVGRGQYPGNDTVLPRKSKRKPSGAFTSVIENLFKIQNEIDAADDINFSLEEDGEFDLFDLWEQKNKEFGTIKKGENPARDIDVPKKISDKKVVSRFARTMLEAGVTPDDSVSEFEKAILDGAMTHEVITNKKARDWARQQVEYLGFEEALNRWTVLSESSKIGKKELALGMELYNQCITNKDVHNAMKIAAELVSEATRAGQTLQATRMLKLMTPDGQLYYLEKSIQKMNEEFRDKLGDKYKDIKLDEELMKEFLSEKDETKRNIVYDNLCQNIADQIPATKLDKWNSWRYLAMLGNPRTHIRNIVGNAVFIPSVRLKNYIGAVIEKAARVDSANRTKSLRKSKEAVEFATKDFDVMTKVLQGENAKYAVTSDIEGKRTIFKTKWLEKLRLKNFDFLEKEDLWFLKMHYVDALARLITVRNIDIESVTPKVLEALRAYAVKEAQAATYRDANALADGLNKLQRKLERNDNKAVRAASVLLEGAMPFKKTPMNIAKQGVNYSPIGILKGAYKAFKKLKDGSATADEVIDDFAKGLTGTGVMLLGLWLASLGILVGAGDKPKKEKEFEKMVGEQSYAVKVKDAFSYTIDWMTPSNLSLFIGAKLYDLAKDDFSFADIVDALSTVTEPLLELSVFSGLNGVIESAQYSDSEALLAIGSEIITSYLMQALPTIGGQLSRIIDESKREYYYTDKNSSIPKGLQSLIGQASSKIPFASYLFEPAIDEWGREEKYGNVLERAFENAVSPGYYAEDNYTAVDKVLKELYERTGESSVFPTTQQKYYVEDKTYYYMSAEDYTEVKRMRGQKSFKYVESLINSSKYNSMSDEEKIKAIKECYDKAGKETKEAMLEKVKSKAK